MAKGVNKVILLGRVGKAPETRYAQNGLAVSSFPLATSESWKDKTGNKQERTEWHNITAFGKLAEIVNQHVTKGMEIYIEGKIQTEKWQDKQGNDRYTTKIIASGIQMLGGRKDGEARPARDQQRQNTPKQDDFEDDIPF
jgi:single-strand DNA-binding protein